MFMGDWVELRAADGQELAAYIAKPAEEAKGALVIVQEIFGVNAHIRSVCDGYAAEGYLVVAPALFDRFEKGVDLSYTSEDQKKAFELYGKLNPETALLDVAAAFQHATTNGGKCAVLGYCYGGLMSWLSATRGKKAGMEPVCCVGYYAGGIGSVAAEEPNCPVMLHFGGADRHIGKDQIDAVRAAHEGHVGEVQIFVYEGAEHGFNRDVGQSFHPEAAALARKRSLAFLREHVG